MLTKLAHILLVSSGLRETASVTMELSKEDYIVVKAETEESCLKTLEQIKPDLILLDKIVSGRDGFEICRRIKSNPNLAEIPVIFLASSENTDDKLSGFRLGGVDYLLTPPHPQELLARIKNHLAISQRKLEVRDRNYQLEELLQGCLCQLSHEFRRRRQCEEEAAMLFEVLRCQVQQMNYFMQIWVDSIGADNPDLAMTLLDLSRKYFHLLQQHLTLSHSHAKDYRAKTTDLLVTEHLATALEIIDAIDSELELLFGNQTSTVKGLQTATNAFSQLSTLEQDILQLTADGTTNPEIAEMLSLKEATIRVYRRKIMNKLQLENIVAVVKFAISNNLTTVN